MLITDLKLLKSDQVVRVSAMVKWEDVDRPDKEIFIQTEERFAPDFTCNPHSFLLGCVAPAMRFGERRIRLRADIDPGLKEGLRTVMALFSLWSGGAYQPLSIEAPTSATAPRHERSRRAGLFLSGGIDSLAALRLNRTTYPASHPGAVKDCLLIHGFDIGGVVARGMKYHVFQRAMESMAPVAADAGVEMILVYTNIRHLCDERELWLNYFFGSVLAAAGHALTPRLNLLYIAASYDLPNLVPCASHPLLDPNFSSSDMPVRHTGAHLSRLDKLRIIAGWDPALQNMRVCLANVPDELNCGKCEKCVRTMLGLEAIGALSKTRAFAQDQVTPGHLDGFSITIRHREPFYRELLAPLKQRGRTDLVEVIQKKLQE